MGYSVADETLEMTKKAGTRNRHIYEDSQMLFSMEQDTLRDDSDGEMPSSLQTNRGLKTHYDSRRRGDSISELSSESFDPDQKP